MGPKVLCASGPVALPRFVRGRSSKSILKDLTAGQKRSIIARAGSEAGKNIELLLHSLNALPTPEMLRPPLSRYNWPAELPTVPETAGLLEESTSAPESEAVPIAGLLPPADERYGDMKVLVVGAGGGVGRAVVKQLAAQGVPVVAMVRDAVRATSQLPGLDQGVQIVEGDVYRYETVARVFRSSGITAVVNAAGPTDRLNPLAPFQVDYQGTENLVAAAKQAGVQKFVLVSSIGTDDPLFPLNLFWGVLFWKKQGELAVQRSGEAQRKRTLSLHKGHRFCFHS